MNTASETQKMVVGWLPIKSNNKVNYFVLSPFILTNWDAYEWITIFVLSWLIGCSLGERDTWIIYRRNFEEQSNVAYCIHPVEVGNIG